MLCIMLISVNQSSFIINPILNFGLSNMQFRFPFGSLIYVHFNKVFLKKRYEKLKIRIMKKSFFKYKLSKFFSCCSILQNITMSKLVILKWQAFEYKANFEKKRRVFLPHFKYDFFKKKCFSSYIFLTD